MTRTAACATPHWQCSTPATAGGSASRWEDPGVLRTRLCDKLGIEVPIIAAPFGPWEGDR